MPVVSITLSKEEIATLTARAKKEQKTASSLMREAVEAYLQTPAKATEKKCLDQPE
ncbi:ribbon-helix-helix protein, CopG family [Brochothrix campestris]|uniref:ribbon-helix-helix protein, CopG family n=1 Tax=Brochothrix campestris TaxID=2757 RepID=UPI0038D08939